MRNFIFLLGLTIAFISGSCSYGDPFDSLFLSNNKFENIFASSNSGVRVLQYPNITSHRYKENANAINLDEEDNFSNNFTGEKTKSPKVKTKQDKTVESKQDKNLSKRIANIEKNTGKKLKVLHTSTTPLILQEENIKQNKNSIVIHKVTQIEPERPDYIKGIYISNYTIRVPEIMKKHIKDAKKYGINTFVIDVQTRPIKKAVIDEIIENGIYPVARVVVFEGGLAQKTPSKEHIKGIISHIEEAAKLGFLEVQLDYIRYADYQSLRKLGLDFKYKVIDEILTKAEEAAQKNNVYISADLFGRVTLNHNDHIGQKLEIFGKRMDVLYPMLYPSHYYFDNYRTTHPYHTVKEGIANSVERVGDSTRVVGYIQGFHMYVDKSGLSFTEYIRQQMQAVEDAGGDGWIIWNPYNKYESSYVAMQAEKKRKQKMK